MEQFSTDGLGMAAMEYVHMVDSIRERAFPSLRQSVVGVGSRNGVFISRDFGSASDGGVWVRWTWHGGDGIHPYSRLHPQRGFSIALKCRCWRGFFRWGRYCV